MALWCGVGRKRLLDVSLVVAALCWAMAPVALEEPLAKEQPKGPAFRYDAKGRRDPFVALVRNGQLISVTGDVSLQLSRPVLYGILWDSGGRSIALINDTEVRVGDMVSGYRVTEIRQDAVVLAVEGGEPVVLQIEFETPPAKGASSDATRGDEE